MSKNVLIISTSLRSGSNSDALAKAFAEGARSAGNNVEEISLRGKSIAFCRSCLACREIGRCVINDDANAIVEKMLHADVIAFATPIYYYEMSGQLKTLLDRANWLFPTDYAFREAYFLSSATEDEPYTPERAEHGFEGRSGWASPTMPMRSTLSVRAISIRSPTRAKRCFSQMSPSSPAAAITGISTMRRAADSSSSALTA